MTMHTIFFKEHQSINGPLSVIPRWTGLGSDRQPVAYDEDFIQSSKLSSLGLATVGHLDAAKELENRQGLGKENITRFTLFSGHCKTAEDGEKVSSAQAAARGHFELGFGRPLICAKYPYAEQCYGVYSAYGTQTIAGRIMLPLSMTADGGPIFVNAKQYSGIMRRRKKRAEAELENRVLKLRKPYLHLSRHLHAMRRPRGNGGRFLNTKNSNTTPKKAAGEKHLPHVPNDGSQLFQVMQYEGGVSSNDSRSTSPGSEVTSDHHYLFSGGTSTNAVHTFHEINNHHPSFHPFQDHVANTGLGIAMASV